MKHKPNARLKGRVVPKTILLVAMVTSVMVGMASLSADEPKAPSNLPKDQLATIRKTLLTGGRAEADKVATELKQLGKLDLDKTDRETWVRMARETAIRQGDRKWLESLRDVPDSFGQDVIYTVLLAYGQLGKAEYKKAKQTLDSLGDLAEVNEREKRRADAIRARIAQLEGKVDEERMHIEKLVDHLHNWTSTKCQSCHNSPQDPKAMTSLPITNLWFGERYVELLRQQGDAEKVKAAAEASLKVSADDEEARVRLGFALKAIKKDSEAEAEFRKLPWADFPGRDLKKPRMMTTFP